MVYRERRRGPAAKFHPSSLAAPSPPHRHHNHNTPLAPLAPSMTFVSCYISDVVNRCHPRAEIAVSNTFRSPRLAILPRRCRSSARVLRVINERLQGRYNLAVPRPAAADAGNDLPLSVQGQVWRHQKQEIRLAVRSLPLVLFVCAQTLESLQARGVVVHTFSSVV